VPEVEERSRERGRLMNLAAVFYAVFVIAALIWADLAELPSALWTTRPDSWIDLVLHAGLGAGFGAAVVLLTRLGLSRIAWLGELRDWFAQLIGPLAWSDAFALALLSAVGEEMFFRGAFQPALGLIPASLVFAALHLPPSKRLLPWTISAGVLGLVFGLMTQWTGNLAAAITAHFVINLFNLKAIAGRDHFREG